MAKESHDYYLLMSFHGCIVVIQLLSMSLES